MKLTENPLFDKFLSLHLPSDECAVFGSGPMYPVGLKDNLGDLDLIAVGAAWEKSVASGILKPVKIGKGQAVELFGGDIEVFNGWAPGEWDIKGLIREADVREGIRFVRLEDVLRWKRLRGLPKDVADSWKIEDYLLQRKSS